MGPQDSRLSRPAEQERSADKDKGAGGQYVAVCSVSNSPLTHNPFATLSLPFRIKCERYIFLKKCFRSSLLLIMFPHVYMYSCIRLYNRATGYFQGTPGFWGFNNAILLKRNLLVGYIITKPLTWFLLYHPLNYLHLQIYVAIGTISVSTVYKSIHWWRFLCFLLSISYWVLLSWF